MAPTGDSSTSPKVPEYTVEEKAWLKKNHGDEFHFLDKLGSSIHRDYEREEGREYLRGWMQQEKDGKFPELNDGGKDDGVQERQLQER